MTMRILEGCLQQKKYTTDGLNLSKIQFNSKLCGFTIELRHQVLGHKMGQKGCIQFTHSPGEFAFQLGTKA